MASVIKIKRSGTTAVPATLASGELAYSWEATTGGKIYIGWGSETTPGEADNIDAIGGKYFTDKLDHAEGTLTANSALVVDDDLKIDIINVDNITIDGNAISSTNLNGNITISPDGTGSVDVDGSKIVNLSTPTANTDAATKLYVDSEIEALGTSSNLDIEGDTGTGSIILSSEAFTVAGGTGLSSAVVDNTVTINLDDTTVTAGSYGSSTEIPVLTVDAQGRITAASTASISTDLLIAGDSGTDTVTSGDTLGFSGGTGITTAVSNNQITISGDDATTTTKGIASFNTNNFTVASGAVTAKDITLGSSTLTLGSTTTAIAGLTQLDVDNIRIDGNTISSTDTDGNIVISPDGTGVVSVNTSRITNVSDPIDPQDAATKQYVDTVAEGLSIKPSVRAATTANLTATYDNGTDGVGSTLTATSNGAFPTIDGVSGWSQFDGILVKDQTNAEENGRYFVSTVGDAGTPWVLTRCGKCDESTEIPSMFIFVQEGTLYNSTGWVATVDTLPMTVGTDDIVFAQFSGAGTYLAGDGLSLTGNEFSVNVDDSSIEISTDALQVKAAGITNDMLAGSIENSKLTNSAITFAAETGTADPVSLGETITFAAGEGINTGVVDNQITISGEDASDTNKGIASFSATDFVVTSGNVEINDEAIQDIVGAFVTGGQAITLTYTDGTDTLEVAADLATTSTVGVASFSSTNFAVSGGGEVTVTSIDGGTY